ncbi:vitellogenin-like [Vespa mandarinia]|uniref:vitellogenin-like n=1 Tax=Vespa mandarinia TaxID=7446 RepID=UPI001607FFDB|nr:vitellogenin-like [Vespa mandarinia]
MRSLFILLLFVGLALSNLHNNDKHAWKVGEEYQYLVRSRTLTGLKTLSDQYAGILMKAILKIQCNSPDTLRAQLLKPQYAQIHKKLPDGWDSHISDQMLEHKHLPLSGEPFVIKFKHGVIRDLIVNKNVPTWEVNIIKSIISQFQADTQGENLKGSKNTQIPEDDNPFASFRVMEDSVSGKCEVLYDIVPLTEAIIQHHPHVLPKPELRKNGEHMYVTKTRNYDKCEQRMDYHFGISGNTKWESDIRNNENIMKKSSTSNMVISGKLKDFVIQTSVTTTKIIMKPRLVDEQESIVISKMNVTLVSINKALNPIPAPNNPESVGNLVYTYNDPFSKTVHRRPGRPSVSPNSMSNELNSASESNENLEMMREKYGKNDRMNYVSDEDKTFWQVKPTLDEAPKNPMLPLFIANNGKAVVMSDKVNSEKMVTTLVQKIANEMENPNIMPDEETLEKFTIVSRLISSMSLEQINKAEENLRSVWNEVGSDETNKMIKENAKVVFRDAVANAGTGPALMTIKRWIEKKQLEECEAGDVLATIPKTARTPTAEYVDAFFSLASDPEVQKQTCLNSSAILSFAELVHHAQVSNNSIYNHYPVNVFGRLSSRKNDAVLRKYIPFLAEQLKKAIKDEDSPRIQVYIIALGLTAHPKILSVLEPYLEGKERVSTYQRFLMVMSLKKLAEIEPTLTRSVLYKIYINTWDVHQIRCAAVNLIMKTNPPLYMLTRIAQFTNFDYNGQVNSVVKSAIKSATKLNFPEWKELSRNARKVLHLLNTESDKYYYSKTYFTEMESNDQLSYRMMLNYIGSDGIIPLSTYVALQPSYNGFLSPISELDMSISSINSLLEMNWHKHGKAKTEESIAEKTAKMLNIESDDVEQVEGNVFFTTPYINRYFSFDNHTIERILRDLQSPKDNRHVNMNKLLSYDITLSFPTETGLPFVYSLHVPIIRKLSFISKPDMNSKFDIRLLMANKHQGRVGFITPFDHQSFVSGIDVNMQVFLPCKLDFHLTNEKSRLDVALQPFKQNSRTRVGHFSVVPYTSQYEVMSFHPLLLEKNTHKIQENEITHIKMPQDSNSVFSVEIETENLVNKFQKWIRNENKWSNMMTASTLALGTYEKFDLYVKPNLQENEAVKFTATLDTKEIRSNNIDTTDESWKSGNEVLKTMHQALDSPARRKEFLQEISKGINSGKAYVIDAGLEIPGVWNNKHACTLCLASSNDENKFRSLFYWYTNIPSQNITHQVCVNGQIRSSPTTPFDYKKILDSHPMKEFSVNIKFGRTCSDDSLVTMKGQIKQSEDYKMYIQESAIVKRCDENMRNSVKDCQKAAEMATNLNEMDMKIIKHDSKRESDTELKQTFHRMTKMLTDLDVQVISELREHQDNTNDKDNDVNIHIKLSPDMTSAEAIISKSGHVLTLSDIDISDKDIDDEDVNEIEKDILPTASCTIRNNEIMTFDDKIYPLKLGKCAHVLFTTFPRNDPSEHNRKMNIRENMEVFVTVEETERNKKELQMLLGNNEILFKSSDTEVSAWINGQRVKCSQKESYRHIKNDETHYEIFELPGSAIKLISDKYDIELVYDKDHVQMTVPHKYQQSIRGLCGDFDGQSENDFVTPKNCLLQNPEEFAATYILKERCEGPALKNAKKAESSNCIEKVIRFSDVVSDREAGRPYVNWKQWGYHKKENKKQCNTYHTRVVTRDDKICFTTRPVPTCSSGCKSVISKEKNYQLYCLPKNEASLGMKRRIEQGANPDLSQRTPSDNETINVPIECVPA